MLKYFFILQRYKIEIKTFFIALNKMKEKYKLLFIAFLFYLIGHVLWTLAIIFDDPILISCQVEEWLINIPFFLFSILGLIASWRLYKHS
tara:strand:+ start:1604 stop:1873 length:270 start_codon:yes stop_codon:yes gene_type:complete